MSSCQQIKSAINYPRLQERYDVVDDNDNDNDNDDDDDDDDIKFCLI